MSGKKSRDGQNRNIDNAIQKLGDAKEEDIVVQILNGALDQRKNRIATVSSRDEDAIRMSGDFVDECDRGNNQTRWLNFRNAACGGGGSITT